MIKLVEEVAMFVCIVAMFFGLYIVITVIQFAIETWALKKGIIKRVYNINTFESEITWVGFK